MQISNRLCVCVCVCVCVFEWGAKGKFVEKYVHLLAHTAPASQCPALLALLPTDLWPLLPSFLFRTLV
uniref:Putative secreted protein n=1 Tax=Anopheles darlingi TaxID=43151 RepID=A0A2M4D392_ANODA